MNKILCELYHLLSTHLLRRYLITLSCHLVLV